MAIGTGYLLVATRLITSMVMQVNLFQGGFEPSAQYECLRSMPLTTLIVMGVLISSFLLPIRCKGVAVILEIC